MLLRSAAPVRRSSSASVGKEAQPTVRVHGRTATRRSCSKLSASSTSSLPSCRSEELRKAWNDAREERRFCGTQLSFQQQDILDKARADDIEAQHWMQFDLFFGLFVVLNGVFIGIDTDSAPATKNDHELAFRIVESTFIGIFVIELALRGYYLGCYRAAKSWWNRFDALIIAVSLVDVLIFQMVRELQFNSGAITALRVMRLFRLMRLIRLLRLFKELYLLVNGMASASKTLLWTVICLFCAVYVGSIFTVELVGKRFPGNPDVQATFGDVPHSILTLLKMTTFQNWPDTMRVVTEDSALHGMYFFFLVYMTISALGLNLVTGIMVTSAMEIAKKDEITHINGEDRARHAAISDLRKLLSDFLEITDDGYITKENVYLAVRNPRFRAKFEEAGMKLSDITTVFDELQGGIDEEVMKMQHVTLKDFIEGCMWVKGNLKPLDLVHVHGGMKVVRKRMILVDQNLHNGILSLRQCLRGVMNSLGPFTSMMKPTEIDPYDTIEKLPITKKVVFTQLTPQEIHAINMEQLELQETKCWAQFDMFFIIVVIANAVVIALRCGKSDEPWSLDWYIVEVSFWAVFFIELCLRSVLFTQLRNRQDDTLFFYFCPNVWEPGLLKEAVINLPKFFRDYWICFDAFILVVSGIDNFVLTWDVELDFNGHAVGVLRILRLVRLLRVARIFRRVKNLWLLITGISTSFHSLVWAALMLVLLLFCASIVMVEMVGKKDDGTLFTPRSTGDEPRQLSLQDQWGDISKAMFTLMQVSTYEDWAVTVQTVTDKISSYYFVFFILFIALSNLGIMNLVIGVMVHSAFGVVRAEKARKETTGIQHAKVLLISAKKVLTETTGDPSYTSTRRSQLSQQDKEVKMVELSEEQLRDSMENAEISTALQAAKLTPEAIKTIFDKLDVTDERKVNLNDFIEGCLRVRQPVTGIDIVGAKVGMRHLGQELNSLNASVAEFENSMVQLLSDLQRMCVANTTGVESGDQVKAAYDVVAEENKTLSAEISMLQKQVRAATKQQNTSPP
eukprot:GEMP01009229.1.p1 GENE.GEMP01009229.1~~GEMP01009229.1.p1  ORF type:complete len:1020 (+),score=247.30 GEMP01009229.1:2-3061(+)